MDTVGIMNTYTCQYIFHLSEFYRVAFIVLASLMKCRSCLEIRTIAFTVLFPEQTRMKRFCGKYKRHLSFTSIVHLKQSNHFCY
jgi:hypothetical protein